MAEVAASVALTEAGTAPATPTPAPAEGGISFVDGADASREAAILDEVLTGAPAEAEAPAEAPAEGDKPAEKPPEAAPVTETKPAEAPANDIESAKLRRGFAKLAEERQKLVELQNAARSERAAAQAYAEKASKFDSIIAGIEKDPAGFLLSHGGEALVQKALQGFIDQEKSPAEREVAKIRAERDQEKAEAQQRQMEQTAAAWRSDIIGKVQGDERFDLVNSLGLHSEVIDVITRYYEVHSKRDDKGNVVEPAILPWNTAAQAVEETRAAKLEASKRYGKRAPAAPEAAKPSDKKDTPPAKQASAPAKKAPTSLSSIPVAEAPHTEDDLPLDPDERERRVLAELGVA